MKKTLKIVGIAMLSMAMFFVSCKQESKIITVENPEIQVKAYPGYNYLVWTPVVDGSVVSVYRDDGRSISVGDSNYYCDKDVEDGVEYTYTLFTNANPASGEYTKVGNKTSVTVKAIKPAYFNAEGKQTTALDLVNYEENANKDYVVNAENIKVYTDSKNEYIYVQVPQKEYLRYDVKLYKGNGFTLDLTDNVKDDPISWTVGLRAAIKTDKIATYCQRITEAGEYRVKVVVNTIDTLGVDYRPNPNRYGEYVSKDTADMYAPNEIFSKKTVTVAALDVSTNTQIKNNNYNGYNYYIDSDTIRIVWTPATKAADATNWASKNYKVYVANNDGNVIYSEVKGIKETTDNNGAVIYYVDYDVKNNDIGYNFVVVLSDNGKLESFNYFDWNDYDYKYHRYNICYVSPYDNDKANLWITYSGFIDLDSDSKMNDVSFTSYSVNSSAKLKSLEYVIVDPAVDIDNILLTGFIKLDAKYDETNKIYKAELKDVPTGKTVVYKWVATEDGKDDFTRTEKVNGSVQ